MSNNTNSISTETASQFAEAAQLLTSAAGKLAKAADELKGLDYPRERIDWLREHADSLYDPKNYLTALEVSGLAKYFMSREKAEGIPVPKLQKLLYNVSVLNGWPMILRDQEPAFYTDIAIECLKKIARLKDSYIPSVLEGEDEF